MVFGLNNTFTHHKQWYRQWAPYPKKPQRKKKRKEEEEQHTKTFLFYKYPLLFSCYITLRTKTFIPYFQRKTIKGVIIFATIVNHLSGPSD